MKRRTRPAALELRPYVATGLPSVRGPLISVFLHALAVVGLAKISVTAPQPKPPLPPPDTETTIQIGDRSYFVAKITPLVFPRQALPKATPAPQASPKLKAGRPDSSAQRAAAPPPAKQAAASQAPRLFIPPTVHRNLISEATLIQPLLPPDLVPVVPELPSFRVQTAELVVPKIPKPFVAPGRRKPPEPKPETPLPPPPSPDRPVVHAEPVDSNVKWKLVLPPPPPAVVDTAPQTTSNNALPPVPAGQPMDILSLSDRPIPVKDQIVVPPGNTVGKTGDGMVMKAGSENGTAAGFSSTGSNEAAASAAGPGGAAGGAGSAASASSSRSGAAESNGVNLTGAATGGKIAGAAGGNNAGAAGGNNAGAAGGNNAGAAGGRNAGAGAAAGSSAPAVRSSAPTVIVRPQNGTFDAVVVQASPIDQFPESKGLLSGRPIYSVYVSANTAKDWTLFFCLPAERQSASVSPNVIELGPVAPVLAPYPTRIVRPSVSLPAFFKYVLVHGFISAAGRFDRPQMVKSVGSDVDDAILSAMSGWEFRPATRDGQPIAVEFLLSIPVAGL